MKGIQINVKTRELFVYVAIFLYCVALFLKRVNIPLDQNILNKAMTLGTMIAVANIVLDFRMGAYQIFLTTVIGFLLVVDSLPTGNHELLYLFFMIWTCRNVESERVIRFIFLTVLVMTGLVAVLTGIGLIENQMVVQNEVRIRYGLGYNVWSILPFQYLSLCMMFMYLSKKKIRISMIMIMLAGAYFIGVYTDTKSSIAITVFAIFCLFVAEYIQIKNWRKCRWLISMPILLTVLSIIMTILFKRGVGFFQRLNMILNQRLQYPAIGFDRYGVGLWANPDVEISGDPDKYFGIDNNYLSLLIVWGIVALAVVLFIYTYLVWYCIQTENIKLLAIVMVMLFTAIMWSRLLVLIEAEYLVCFSNAFERPSIRRQRPDKEFG